MPTNTLGGQSFIYFNRQDIPGGSPEIIGDDVEVFQRPGTDGSAIRRNGVKGMPFTVRSCAAATDASAAATGINAYKAMQGGSPQTLVWDDVNFASAFDTKYVVLKVREIDWHAVYNLIVDGVIVSQALLIWAVWDLVPVEAT